MKTGVTDRYSGHPEAYFFNDRVEADRFGVLGPRATLTPQTRQHVKPRSPDEITTYCEKQGWNSTDIRALSRASDHLKRQNTDLQAANNPPSATGARTEELSARSLATINSAIQAFFTSQSSEERPVPLGFSEEANSATTPSSLEEADAFTSDTPIDTGSEEYREFALDVALEDDFSSEGPLVPSSTASQFVTWLSTINSVKTANNPHSFPRHMPCEGSSKDLPTHFSTVPAGPPVVRIEAPSNSSVSKDLPFHGTRINRMLPSSRESALIPV